MNQHQRITSAASAFLGIVALSGPSAALAQTGLSGIGVPRSTDERVVTGTPTPPPVNSDARRAADGQLIPGAPGVGGAIDPGRALGTTGPARDRAMDPAARLIPAVPGVGRVGAYPVGMESALLAEHALGMAIEGSALKTIAERAKPGPDGDGSARMLLDHANRLMAESRGLIDRAAVDTPSVAASVPARRFQLAAQGYIATLAALGNSDSADRTQMALINHAVKEVLDADHIGQMARMAAGNVALEPLMVHARNMKNEGTQTLLRLAGNGPVDPNATSSVPMLARRGRELIDAAGELGAVLSAQAATAPGVVAPLPAGPNPGRFQDNRPEIIGGTFGTSTPTAGTYTGKGDPLNPAGLPPIQNSASPVPTPADRSNSNGSSGGLPPR